MKKADKAVIANEIRSLVLFYSNMMANVREGKDAKVYEEMAVDALQCINSFGIPVKLLALENSKLD